MLQWVEAKKFPEQVHLLLLSEFYCLMFVVPVCVRCYFFTTCFAQFFGVYRLRNFTSLTDVHIQYMYTIVHRPSFTEVP